jgi:vitamin B12 transporter
LKDQRMNKSVWPNLAAILLPACLAAAASAQETAATPDTNNVSTLPPVVITGTRIPTPPENTSSPVTVIAREEIAQSHQRLVADVLRGEPGVEVARTGQPGSLSSVFLRGANNSHTLVLVDGIRVNNAFNNAFDFGSLAVDNLERIEILRGPQSTLYGSEALGGVINLVTRRGEGRPTGAAQVEYGSFNSLLTRGSFAAREGRASVSADASYASSDNDRINSDFWTANLSSRAGYEVSDRFSMHLLATYLKSEAGAPNDRFTNDPNDRMKNENWLVGLTLDARPANWWDAKLTLSHARERGAFDQPPPNPPFFFGDYASLTIAERNQVDFQNVFTPADGHKLLAGGTFEDSSANYADNFSALDRTIDTRSAYTQYEFSPHPRITLTAGGRVDDSSAFGTHGTYRFGSRYTVPVTETILRANVGTGFRAPSISQLYYPVFGNPNLRPEESVGWDAGVEQPLASEKLRLGATVFHNDFTDLISGYPARNVDRARTYGVETFVSWRPLTNLTFRTSYTWLDAKDLATSLRLDRRAEHSGSVSARWEICPQLEASVRALFVGERPDANYAAFPPARVTLRGYAKVDLSLTCRLSKNLSLQGRVENLLDQRYEDVFGFPALGRCFAGGATLRF